jgi:hypothetical protein
LRQYRRVYDLEVNVSNETNIQDILNYTGSSLLNLNCILSGLANQLKETQGTSAIEAAQAYAVELAKTHPAGPVKPDVAAIAKFFNDHK